MLYLDEAGKWEKANDIRERGELKGHAYCWYEIVEEGSGGSTVNPMNKGGEEYKGLWYDSDPNERINNGRTRSGLYRIFIPAYDALEGFFDEYGNAVVRGSRQSVHIHGIDGDTYDIGSRTYLKNERQVLQGRSLRAK